MKFVTTVIYVKNVEETLDFYVKAFGFSIGFLHPNKQFGSLTTGSTALAFASEESGRSYMGDFAPNSINNPLPYGFEVAFSTGDVQQAYDHAISCGALPIRAPEKRHWGQIIAYVRDLNGIIVEICSE